MPKQTSADGSSSESSSDEDSQWWSEGGVAPTQYCDVDDNDDCGDTHALVFPSSAELELDLASARRLARHRLPSSASR